MTNTELAVIVGVGAVGAYLLIKRKGGLGIPGGTVQTVNPPPNTYPGGQGYGPTFQSAGSSGGGGSSSTAAASVGLLGGILGGIGGLIGGIGSAVRGIPSWGTNGGDTVTPLGGSGSTDYSSLDDPNAFQLGGSDGIDISSGYGSYTNSISLGGDPTNSGSLGSDPLGVGSLSLGD